MRAAHPPIPRTSSMVLRLMAMTAVVTLALTIGSCSLGEGSHRLVVSSLTAQEADAVKPQDSISDMDNQPLSTASGVVTMSTSYVDEGIGSTAGKLTTTVVSRERSTNRFQWAVSIKPAVADRKRTEDSNSTENPLHNTWHSRPWEVPSSVLTDATCR